MCAVPENGFKGMEIVGRETKFDSGGKTTEFDKDITFVLRVTHCDGCSLLE